MSLKKFITSKKENLKSERKYDQGDILRPELELLLHEYENGGQMADGCCVDWLSHVFSWKRGFQNVFTGYPNDGKTQFTLWLMTQKALCSGWKWVIWSPEMKSGSFVNGDVIVNYNDFYNEIAWVIDGRTPHKHIAQKYNVPQIPKSEYIELIKLIGQHFITIDPKNKKPEDIYDLLIHTHEMEGFDGILIDPFKNVEQDIRVRDDIYMEQLFARFKDLSVRTNSVMNWIGHPKANIQRIDKEGNLKPCDQFMLNGGAAWNNSMDGVYSVFRPKMLEDIKSNEVNFLNLKQRKQELTTERGVVTDIFFDAKTRQYTKDFIGF